MTPSRDPEVQFRLPNVQNCVFGNCLVSVQLRGDVVLATIGEATQDRPAKDPLIIGGETHCSASRHRRVFDREERRELHA